MPYSGCWATFDSGYIAARNSRMPWRNIAEACSLPHFWLVLSSAAMILSFQVLVILTAHPAKPLREFLLFDYRVVHVGRPYPHPGHSHMRLHEQTDRADHQVR